MKFVDLKKSLSTIKSVYIVFGEDDFLIKHSIAMIKDVAVTALVEMNVLSLDALSVDKQQIHNAINTLPFLSERKVVILHNIDLDKDILQTMTDHANEGSKIVVILVRPKSAAKLSKAETVDCSPLDKNNLKNWILAKVTKHGQKITNEAIDSLIDTSEGLLTSIAPELDKVMAYADKDIINSEIIDRVVFKNEVYLSYNLTNAYEHQDVEKILLILDILGKSENAQSIFSAIGGYFRRLCYCAVSKVSDEILATYLNVKPYSIKKLKSCAAAKNIAKCRDKYIQYVTLDEMIKSGKITATSAINSLLLT